MSEQTIEQMKAELDQAKNNFKGLCAQLDATKQMMNEQLASNLQLRSTIIIFQNAHKENMDECAKLKTENEALKDQILKQGEDNQVLRDKIAILEAPVTPIEEPVSETNSDEVPPPV